DGNGSHASTLKSPSYTKSVSWQHYPQKVLLAAIVTETIRSLVQINLRIGAIFRPFLLTIINIIFR
ncbi:hypothetical protein OSL02_03560, partial [Escherichia coli]|nr:hypothetical protein [Escherichia coli]